MVELDLKLILPSWTQTSVILDRSFLTRGCDSMHTVACSAASGSLFVKWMQFALADGGPCAPFQVVNRS